MDGAVYLLYPLPISRIERLIFTGILFCVSLNLFHLTSAQWTVHLNTTFFENLSGFPVEDSFAVRARNYFDVFSVNLLPCGELAGTLNTSYP